MEHLHHFRNGHQNCAPSWTSMGSSTSIRWTQPSGRTLPSISIIFVLELNQEQQLKMASPHPKQASRLYKKSLLIPIIFGMRPTSAVKSESLKLTSLRIKPTLMMSSTRSRGRQTTSATSWFIQPRQGQSQIVTSDGVIRRLHQSENGFESWRLLRLR